MGREEGLQGVCRHGQGAALPFLASLLVGDLGGGDADGVQQLVVGLEGVAGDRLCAGIAFDGEPPDDEARLAVERREAVDVQLVEVGVASLMSRSAPRYISPPLASDALNR